MLKTLLPSARVCPDYSNNYSTLVRGEGIYLYDKDGNQFIDGSGAASAVTLLGHGSNEIAEVLRQQAASVAVLPTHFFRSSVVDEYARELVAFAPPGISTAWFVSGGSEAIESAIHLARQFHYLRGDTSRYKVVGRWQAYHGATGQALDVSGIPMRRTLYSPGLRHSQHAPPAYCFRCPFGRRPDSCVLECAQAIEDIIIQEGPETVSAVVAEPVVGAALGAVTAPDGYFQEVRRICNRHGVLLIIDEVMTGFGRTGKNFGIEHWGITPDIMALAKGMSAGYFPLGGILIRQEVAKVFADKRASFSSGFTFACNPMGAAVGRYVLRQIQERELVSHAAKMGELLVNELSSSLSSSSIVGEIRGLGLLVGVEFVKDRSTREPWPVASAVASKVGAAALRRRLITYPGTGSVKGHMGDHVKLAPPLIISPQEVRQVAKLLSEAIHEVAETLQ